ncbi:nucleotide kinase domain-containing protein [Neorhizobium tomejilense]|uniref:nucleotide kinase domain-containing protein n=1 Tax=Neorhizobium tomejilense TaxID=2093828 RepID=UPI001FE0898C|nr:nucleotide kinase domain-containing protein [Neorhizobium tomejilense]
MMTQVNSPMTFVRKTPPALRAGVYELYWTFASRRQAAYEQRLSGASWPWTSDRILQVYKFCNVFRASDRVSQYMIKDVAYAVDNSSAADRIFQIVAFRTFSNIATWRTLRAYFDGAPTLEHLRSGEFESALDKIKKANGGLYTGAFILCANKAYGFDEKHRNHVGLFKHMFLENKLDERIRAANSLEQVVRHLQDFPLMGPFMAYQTAIDLNYSSLLDFSENDYTQAGPGAIRGLKKAFTDLNDYSPSDAILWMTEKQEAEFERLELPFEGLFGRPLHAIDCQGLFCELDKYCREAVPELLSNRSRIKARFTASSEAIDLFFPPKWSLTPWTKAMPIHRTEDQMTLDFGFGEQRRSAAKRTERHHHLTA